MPRSLLLLIVVVIVLVGGLFFLSSLDTSKEPQRMEKVIPLENLT